MVGSEGVSESNPAVDGRTPRRYWINTAQGASRRVGSREAFCRRHFYQVSRREIATVSRVSGYGK
ncbi:protein of unknown function [Paraburkholderia kururiensis]